MPKLDPDRDVTMADRPYTPIVRDVIATRMMTADEAQMARYLSCSKLPLGRHKGAIRMLHVRTHSADRTITEAEAALLRSHVIAFKSVLPEAIVRMAGGTK